MARRRKQNNMGSAYLVLFGIGFFVIMIFYWGFIKDPTKNIERNIQTIDLELKLDNKL